MLGLRFCARVFSSCGERGLLFIAVHRPLTVVASPVAEHRLQTRRLSICGSRSQMLHGMWDLPRQGLKPVSPALAGRFLTTAPPGKTCLITFKMFILIRNYFNWNEIQFFICFILWCVLYVLFKKTLPIPRLWRYSLIFYSTNFIFLAFMFRSMVCLKVIFVYGWLAV